MPTASDSDQSQDATAPPDPAPPSAGTASEDRRERTALSPDRRAAWAAAVLGLTVIVLLKVGTVPGAWAKTQYLMNYEFGVIKRGLFGELLRLVLGDARFERRVLETVGVTILAILLGGTLLCGWRRRSGYLLLFLASPGTAYFVYLVGYLDQVLYLLALLAGVAIFRLRRLHFQLMVYLGVGVVSLMIHEAALLTTMPLLSLALVMARVRQGEPLASARAATIALVPLAVLACAAYLIASTLLPTPERLDAWYQAQLAKADFPLFPGAIAVLARSLGGNVRMIERAWRGGKMLPNLHAVLPSFILFVFLFLDGARRALERRSAPATIGVAAAAMTALAPLSLLIIGADVERWLSLAMVNAYAALLIITEGLGEDDPRERAFPYPPSALAALILVGVFTSIPTFLGEPMRLPPFFRGTITGG